MNRICKEFFAFFSRKPDFLKTLRNSLICIAVILLFSAVEFACLYFTKTNMSFWNGFLQAIPYNLLFAVPVFFLGKWGTRIYLTLLTILLFVITCAALFLAIHFKSQLDSDIFLIAKVSSPKEIREFTGMFWSWRTFALFLVMGAVSAAWIVFVWRTDWKKVSRLSCLTGVLLLLPGAISAYRYAIWFHEPEKVTDKVTLIRFCTGFFRFDREYQTMVRMAESPELPAGIHLKTEKAKEIIGIVVIGESANRSHQGVYGYARNTTPKLEQYRKELFLFDNAACTRPCTSQSLYAVFTQYRASQPELPPRCTLADVLRQAGFYSRLYSSQFRWGIGDSPMTMILGHANENHYIQEDQRNVFFDDELLNRIGDLEQMKGGELLFLHLLGSHFDPASRYPETWAPFTNQPCGNLTGRWLENTNEYDNSIAFTDAILGELIRRLKATGKPAFLLYFSDHGDVVIDAPGKPGRSIHSKDPDSFAVPLILWTSESYRKLFPEVLISGQKNLHKAFLMDDLFWTLPALLQITWPGYREDLNLFSDACQPQPHPFFKAKP